MDSMDSPFPPFHESNRLGYQWGDYGGAEAQHAGEEPATSEAHSSSLAAGNAAVENVAPHPHGHTSKYKGVSIAFAGLESCFALPAIFRCLSTFGYKKMGRDCEDRRQATLLRKLHQRRGRST